MEQWDCSANQSHSGIQTDGAATISTVDCHHASGLKKKKGMQIAYWILMLLPHYFHSCFVSQNRSHGCAEVQRKRESAILPCAWKLQIFGKQTTTGFQQMAVGCIVPLYVQKVDI